MDVEWVRLALDLNGFDAVRFEPYVRGARRAGIGFTTLAGLGDTPGNRRALYELDLACAADSPERGEFRTFDEYFAWRAVTPAFDPYGVVLALDGGAWVGMAMTSVRPGGDAFSEMTGLLAGCRGRGISPALKLLAVSFARSRGARRLRAVHHPANAPAIAVNRRFGFVDEVRGEKADAGRAGGGGDPRRPWTPSD
ncbi:GNAT family N-acetyltransferase [Kitasatospora sp. NPDC058170]|uniref:GNAT family N-acetyltransferase n=1 Tax=Kitasatospora sp. NPDC058170 TaxID=3346364 RepID=UPI0036D8D550